MGILTTQIAKHFRDVHFGGNWSTSCLREHLQDLTWEQATTPVGNLNTIAALAFHINYYVCGLINVFNGGALDIRDKYSYDLPPIQSQSDWDQFLAKIWAEAETFAQLVADMPDEILEQDFTDPKYGNYFRNLHGIIEHCHYHLGQIVVIKKLLASGNA